METLKDETQVAVEGQGKKWTKSVSTALKECAKLLQSSTTKWIAGLGAGLTIVAYIIEYL